MCLATGATPITLYAASDDMVVSERLSMTKPGLEFIRKSRLFSVRRVKLQRATAHVQLRR